MQTTFRILILLSFVILFQFPAHSQKKSHKQKKTTLEVFTGISLANSTRLHHPWLDNPAYSYTLKYRLGSKLYTSLGKRLNFGFGLNFFNTGYGYDSEIIIPNEVINTSGIEQTFLSLESSEFYRSFWHIGIPLTLNVQLNKPSRKNRFSTYFELGATPSFTQFSRERNIHPQKKETEIDGDPRYRNGLALVNTSVLFEYHLSSNLNLIFRPSFQLDPFRNPRTSNSFEQHHDFNIEAGIRTRLYKWWR